MDGPVLGVRDASGDVRLHLFGCKTVLWGSIVDV